MINLGSGWLLLDDLGLEKGEGGWMSGFWFYDLLKIFSRVRPK